MGGLRAAHPAARHPPRQKKTHWRADARLLGGRVATRPAMVKLVTANDRSYGRPKTYMVQPAAMATYCLPSTPNEIGFACTGPPSCMSQSGFPFSASSAKKLTSF